MSTSKTGVRGVVDLWKSTFTKFRIGRVLCALILTSSVNSVAVAESSVEVAHAAAAKSLVAQAVKAMGGKDAFYAKGDVQYRYTYRVEATGEQDVSTERYVFDGEHSWARYSTHTKFVMPDFEGDVIQYFNGESTAVQAEGKPVVDAEVLKMADFLRKTNYYWFSMMFKLLDDGLHYELLEPRLVGDQQYQCVKVSFDSGVGSVQDVYLLYFNPETGLIDQFLFTVMDFGKAEPFLMEVEYSEVDGVMLPAKRRYAPANWQGEVLKTEWVYEISEDIQFNNGFVPEYFYP